MVNRYCAIRTNSGIVLRSCLRLKSKDNFKKSFVPEFFSRLCRNPLEPHPVHQELTVHQLHYWPKITGMQQLVKSDKILLLQDINEILMHCGSTAWSDRKEGLVGLQAWLQAGNTLDPTQLKLITECFTKMFMDSHTKVGITFSQIYLQQLQKGFNSNPLIDF